MKHDLCLTLEVHTNLLIVDERMSYHHAFLIEDEKAFHFVLASICSFRNKEEELGIVSSHAMLDQRLRGHERLSHVIRQERVVALKQSL